MPRSTYYQRQRRELAKARKRTFLDPPDRRNRVWQMDFSEFETLSGGIWRLCAVVDYATKTCLACRVATTQTHRDAILTVEQARQRTVELLGLPRLADDCIDRDTGEITSISVVSDNGAAFRAARFARYIAGTGGELAHVRTRHKASETNGVVERFFESLKYEHLYREEITTGFDLAVHTERFVDLYNRIRPTRTSTGTPHSTASPPTRHRPRTPTLPRSNLSKELDAGHQCVGRP